MNKNVLAMLSAAVALLLPAQQAEANGFGRGSADTDILYEDGNFNARMGMTYVSPQRKFTRNANPRLVGTDYLADYVVPSLALKVNVTDNFRCAFTMVENNGGDAEYAFPTSTGKISEKFDTTELGATCGLKFDTGPGNIWLLGGGFIENFDYARVNDYTPLGLGYGTLDLKGKDHGYRLGIAYEIPDIAMRAQLMYRSGTDYGADGIVTATAAALTRIMRNAGVADSQNPFINVPPGIQVPLSSTGEGNLPQIVELKAQTGIAPGWLAFGTVRWTNWSVQKTVDIFVGDGVLVSRDNYHWDDGWTITGGIAHAFTDTFSGALSLTWDQGVSTGWDIQTDVWTLGAGVSAKDAIGGELRAGVGISYLESGEETRYAPGLNSAVDSGWAYTGTLAYKMKW